MTSTPDAIDPLAGEITRELLELFAGEAPEKAARVMTSVLSMLAEEGEVVSSLTNAINAAAKLAGAPLENIDAEIVNDCRDTSGRLIASVTAVIESCNSLIASLVVMQAGPRLIGLIESLRERLASRLATLRRALEAIHGR
jgi:hypothetical protein